MDIDTLKQAVESDKIEWQQHTLERICVDDARQRHHMVEVISLA